MTARTLALALLALSAAAVPAGAKGHHAPRPPAAVRDCIGDGDLDRPYSRGELRRALRALPSDVAQYTACSDVLRAAYTAGPVLVSHRGRVRIRIRCAGEAFPITLSARGRTIASGDAPACASGTRVAVLTRTSSLRGRRHRHLAVRVVLRHASFVAVLLRR
jgi:hypothetical protein